MSLKTHIVMILNGRFVEPYIRTVRDISLNNSYVVVIDKIEVRENQSQSEDKILSVEPVMAD